MDGERTGQRPYSPTGTGAVEKRQKSGAMTVDSGGGVPKKSRFGIAGVARIPAYYPNTLCISQDFVYCKKNHGPITH